MKTLKWIGEVIIAIIAVGLYLLVRLCGLKDEDLEVMPVEEDS